MNSSSIAMKCHLKDLNPTNNQGNRCTLLGQLRCLLLFWGRLCHCDGDTPHCDVLRQISLSSCYIDNCKSFGRLSKWPTHTTREDLKDFATSLVTSDQPKHAVATSATTDKKFKKWSMKSQRRRGAFAMWPTNQWMSKSCSFLDTHVNFYCCHAHNALFMNFSSWPVSLLTKKLASQLFMQKSFDTGSSLG